MAQSSLYGGTFGALTHDFTDLGIQHTLVSAQDPAAWAVALRPETRVFYAEAITNPLLEVCRSLGQAWTLMIRAWSNCSLGCQHGYRAAVHVQYLSRCLCCRDSPC